MPTTDYITLIAKDEAKLPALYLQYWSLKDQVAAQDSYMYGIFFGNMLNALGNYGGKIQNVSPTFQQNKSGQNITLSQWPDLFKKIGLKNLIQDKSAGSVTVRDYDNMNHYYNVETGDVCGHGGDNEGGSNSFYCTTGLTYLYINTLSGLNDLINQLLTVNNTIYNIEQEIIRYRYDSGQQNAQEQANLNLQQQTVTSSPGFLQYKGNMLLVYIVLILVFLFVLVKFVL